MGEIYENGVVKISDDVVSIIAGIATVSLIHRFCISNLLKSNTVRKMKKGTTGSEYIAILELMAESKTKVDRIMTAKKCSNVV